MNMEQSRVSAIVRSLALSASIETVRHWHLGEGAGATAGHGARASKSVVSGHALAGLARGCLAYPLASCISLWRNMPKC